MLTFSNVLVTFFMLDTSMNDLAFTGLLSCHFRLISAFGNRMAEKLFLYPCVKESFHHFLPFIIFHFNALLLEVLLLTA